MKRNLFLCLIAITIAMSSCCPDVVVVHERRHNCCPVIQTNYYDPYARPSQAQLGFYFQANVGLNYGYNDNNWAYTNQRWVYTDQQYKPNNNSYGHRPQIGSTHPRNSNTFGNNSNNYSYSQNKVSNNGSSGTIINKQVNPVRTNPKRIVQKNQKSIKGKVLRVKSP